MSVHCRSKQTQFGIRQSTLQETGSTVCEVFVKNPVLMYSFSEVQYLGVHLYRSSGWECVFKWVCTSICLHTSVWKSPSDESGVLAEDESQFLLCSSMRSFCSPGTMDSSGVMVLKPSQELWISGVDLSWWRGRTKKRAVEVSCGWEGHTKLEKDTQPQLELCPPSKILNKSPELFSDMNYGKWQVAVHTWRAQQEHFWSIQVGGGALEHLLAHRISSGDFHAVFSHGFTFSGNVNWGLTENVPEKCLD